MLSDAKAALGLAAVPAILGLALLTSGCNTMRGMGEDVSAAGGAMSSTAEKTEEKIEGTMADESDKNAEMQQKSSESDM
jgi:entericidin B